ncbi:TPA: hypothetical protein N0F65_005371 [Lagenidium giganteum]|uniref:Uncharacterized protein n=1 Tax=Lagenidium giganteum TaxID=4803 RepID=A0AAV2YLB3_9STRA|nr:TPA: hypothetical protein N0F65_005371 [Lagenidium giganteum]
MHYNFGAAARLLSARATQRKLLGEKDAEDLNDFVIQEQWMLLNPIDEADDDADENLPHEVALLSSPFSVVGDEVAASEEVRIAVEVEALSADENKDQADASDSAAPKLELSLSEDDLDALLRSLPASPPFDSEDDSPADERCGDGRGSEMQWVLSFLSDPNAAAQHDAEAKNLLGISNKQDDDNYQSFLRELDQHDYRFRLEPKATNLTETAIDESEDSEEEDWELNRRAIKAKGGAEMPAASTEKRAKSVKTNADKKLPSLPTTPGSANKLAPPAPMQWNPPATKTTLRAPEVRSTSRLPQWSGRMASSTLTDPSTPANPKDKRMELCMEINQMLQNSGEFQFPRHMFPLHNENNQCKANQSTPPA